ncbi:hypothetical protein BB558_004031 [Smittium angustum]|uniref:Non-structural maintenance of chromosomes element 4 n=1 Tax=Smittium angustum TaxID=133377 RepID=A0A2U1IZN9_SMIAN|nr:hypothetical protein BB558_005726 [Smittium angustum]PVZ99932.1 hypothetical protein BB558_004031 [Smittium angustum]
MEEDHNEERNDRDENAGKRRLRKSYRKKLEETEQNKMDLIEASTEVLVEEIRNANKLFKEVKTTYEASLDSRLLLMSAAIGEAKARRMRLEASGYDVEEYIRAVRKKLFGKNADQREMAGVIGDWSKIGKLASMRTKRVPGLDAISGPLNADPPKRRALRKINKKEEDKKAKRTTKVGELNQLDFKKQINETTKRVREIHGLLEQIGLINLFEFVVNPFSFPETVENIFYLSFLIRDGKAFIDDESGQPIIAACEPPDQEAYMQGLTKKQVVFDIDMETWKKLITVYSIEKSMIPPRSETEAQ